MRPRFFLPLLALPLLGLPWACSASGSNGNDTSGSGGDTAGNGGSGTTSSTTTGSGSSSGSGGDLFPDGGLTDASNDAPPLNPDAACAAVSSEATIETLPVDIVWMVDNSASMEPAVTQIKNGLNSFANLIGSKNLDYKVIMLSLKSKTSPITVAGKTRYPVCIPAPLAGDDNCGNGPRFFQSSIDIKSTQPLEQFLGTLGQTDGYLPGQDRGGEPWKQELRPQATKTLVVVTDDNSRLTPTDFEHFAGGQNPFNSLALPPGILDPSWGGLFADYLFSGIYGWGSNTDPNVTCKYPDMSMPPSSGPTYTTLVKNTNGVRAKLCDGSSAWDPFFNAVAQAVETTAKLSCTLAIPTPPMGTLDPNLVNVALYGNGMQTYLPRVDTAAACANGGGWYYDDPVAPKNVILCQSSCDEAQAMVGPNKTGKIQVLFGCGTILK